MNIKMNNWLNWFFQIKKEFIAESSKPKYEIVDDYTCAKTGKKKIVIKISSRYSKHCSLDEVILSDDYIEGLDKKTIRALACAAIAEKMTPEYTVFSNQEIEDNENLLKFKSKNGKISAKLSSETYQDRKFLSKLSSLDAHQIGYIAGINKTVKEFQALQAIHKREREL